jgi:hypothetical protein
MGARCWCVQPNQPKREMNPHRPIDISFFHFLLSSRAPLALRSLFHNLSLKTRRLPLAVFDGGLRGGWSTYPGPGQE